MKKYPYAETIATQKLLSSRTPVARKNGIEGSKRHEENGVPVMLITRRHKEDFNIQEWVCFAAKRGND